ncbi:oxidoreductase [Salinibacillus xinjiangensis]|uniref:NAD(P)-binding protein n=1 Tax=Salinibacillus xinjiangensis TaxID=1229268 RepID=A0A6G1X1J4_9BACI|nr:FAD-dependent oxidoreductase [Salinibacillus xinjiangensis]MRG84853.1 NAD(P)-binding protein [Salinibacillus xinjiangensis]
MSRNFEKLFSPINVGSKTLSNRITMAEVLNNYGEKHEPTMRQAKFYGERAKGGVAMIVTEGFSVHPTSLPQPQVPIAYTEENIDKFKMIADEVHKYDTVLLGQLWHVGRQQLWSPTMSSWGVSELPCPLSDAVPHAMTVEEIKEIEDSFVSSAINLSKAGFDGVSLHGAHGYLITQFLSKWTNKRKDEYGGSLENRTRFIVNIVNKIKENCGKDFIVGIKLTVHEYVEGGLDLTESKNIVQYLNEKCALDYYGVSQGNFSHSLEYHVPDMHLGETPFIHLTEEIKKVAGDTPVLGLGKITNPNIAEHLLHEGKLDLVGMGRALISDAELPNKAKTGDVKGIRECNSCNVCWGEIHSGKPMVCIHNPSVGNEKDYGIGTLIKTKTPKKVMVIGGGPAGLEAASIAAERGHNVHLFEKESNLGGQLRRAIEIPGREELIKTLNYLTYKVKSNDVNVYLDTIVDETLVDEITPDVVLYAAGSNQEIPDHENKNYSIYSYEEAVAKNIWNGSVLIFEDDGDIPPYSLTEKIAKSASEVTILTKKAKIAHNVNYVSWLGVNRRLRKYENIDYITGYKINKLNKNDIEIEHTFGGSKKDIAYNHVIYITKNKSNHALFKKISKKYRSYNIGDSYAPRKVLAAIHEAHRLARSI